MPATCVGTDSVYGSSTFSSSAITHAGATAKPSRTAASDHTFEYVRTTTSGRVVVDELERAPRRELAVRLVDDEQRAGLGRDRVGEPLDRRRAASTVPVGLFGLHTNTTAGRADRDQLPPPRRRRSRSRRARSPATTSVAVLRAMCACSAYVGSNISARRPGPP